MDYAYIISLLYHRWDYTKANLKALQEGAERIYEVEFLCFLKVLFLKIEELYTMLSYE